jgi:hypothetical protein
MTLYLNPNYLVWNRFDSLEPPEPSWLDQLPYWEEYTAAFFRSNGLEYLPEDGNVKEWLQAADRAPFVKMADVLLRRLTDRGDLHDVDFVLLAHWLPDLHLGTSVTNFAMHRLALKNAFGFAISDRGLSAPLFALDCIDKYTRDGRTKALLMVMDQKHLLYRSTLRDSLRPHNNACVMLLERDGRSGLEYLGYCRRVLTAPDALSEECRAVLHPLSLRNERTTVITSDPLVASAVAPVPVVTADRRLVCAAPFVALSESLTADHDYLLLTRDDHGLCAVGFRSPEADR